MALPACIITSSLITSNKSIPTTNIFNKGRLNLQITLDYSNPSGLHWIYKLKTVIVKMSSYSSTSAPFIKFEFWAFTLPLLTSFTFPLEGKTIDFGLSPFLSLLELRLTNIHGALKRLVCFRSLSVAAVVAWTCA